MKISKKEYNQIIKELAERIKDLIYINLENNLKKHTPKKIFENFCDKDDIDFTYTFHLVNGDIKQILGRCRRNK